jgi:integrase
MAKLTDVTIRNMKAGPTRREIPDGHGLYLMINPSGKKRFCFRYRFDGTPKKLTLAAGLGLAAARKAAADAALTLEQGIDPSATKKTAEEAAAAAAADTLGSICNEYMKREGGKLRSVDQRTRLLKQHVHGSTLAKRPIGSIRRKEIIRLLDTIEDASGARTSEACLAILRRIFNWHAVRDDEFLSPFVKGMGRIKPKERERHRVLTDDELRAVWKAAEATAGPYGALIRFWLLTGARRDEARALPWLEVDVDIWTLPKERNKTKEVLIRPLSAAARAILEQQPRIDDCKYVFSLDGRRPIAGLSNPKRRLDKACGVTDWIVHDLRRTARSLMSRAGVNTDVAERCLGHVIGGVRSVYDQHGYVDEMRAAFEKLAALIERLVHPQENVVALRG